MSEKVVNPGCWFSYAEAQSTLSDYNSIEEAASQENPILKVLQGLTLTFQGKKSKGLQASKIKAFKQKVRSPSGSRLDADEQSLDFVLSRNK